MHDYFEFLSCWKDELFILYFCHANLNISDFELCAGMVLHMMKQIRNVKNKKITD